MKNTFGNNITITLFGESHGPAIGCVLDGIAPGIKVDEDYIDSLMDLRRPKSKISTSRHEADKPKILSGVFNGFTTGTPISIIIENANTHSGDYAGLNVIPRPGHADYTAGLKYHGFQDYRGGGHFSGRITAPIVAAGAIILSALNNKGIYIGTHISSLGDIKDRDFVNYLSDIEGLYDKDFPTLDEETADKMRSCIEAAAAEGDSVGGILKTAVIGVPGGIGEPWFDSVESMLSHALFSIPAVKGVQFGKGFDLANMKGSEANDPYRISGDKVVTATNNNGGINGGISNGMPIEFSTVIKPTPSIYKQQDSVDLDKRSNTKLSIEGRHDPAIIHRARIVVDAMTAITIADLLVTHFGTDYLA
ncbi:MAG: chorismate synthase [Lachnospiraceae bacterium]|nr:chorismate synthase [Lachnospiraceae bacterium]